MNLTYEKCGDYLIPNIIPDPEPGEELRKFGLMRKNYLKEYKSGIYQGMVLSGKLKEHLLMVQEQAELQFDVLVEQMAELGESCYFNTKQCVAAWLVLSGMINVMILFLIAGYLNYHWSVGLLQVGLYILTPYLVSSITALGILSMETRGKNSSLFGMSAILLSISYGVIGSIPRALFVTTLWIWAVAFLVSGLLFVIQIKKLLSKMEKGEVLCTN